MTDSPFDPKTHREEVSEPGRRISQGAAGETPPDTATDMSGRETTSEGDLKNEAYSNPGSLTSSRPPFRHAQGDEGTLGEEGEIGDRPLCGSTPQPEAAVEGGAFDFPSSLSVPPETVIAEALGCENDEGFGCSCCPWRPSAYAALAALTAERDEAQESVRNAWATSYAQETRAEAAEARVRELEAPLEEISVDVVLADDLTVESQLSALWGVVRRHSQIARAVLRSGSGRDS